MSAHARDRSVLNDIDVRVFNVRIQNVAPGATPAMIRIFRPWLLCAVASAARAADVARIHRVSSGDCLANTRGLTAEECAAYSTQEQNKGLWNSGGASAQCIYANNRYSYGTFTNQTLVCIARLNVQTTNNGETCDDLAYTESITNEEVCEQHCHDGATPCEFAKVPQSGDETAGYRCYAAREPTVGANGEAVYAVEFREQNPGATYTEVCARTSEWTVDEFAESKSVLMSSSTTRDNVRCDANSQDFAASHVVPATDPNAYNVAWKACYNDPLCAAVQLVKNGNSTEYQALQSTDQKRRVIYESTYDAGDAVAAQTCEARTRAASEAGAVYVAYGITQFGQDSLYYVSEARVAWKNDPCFPHYESESQKAKPRVVYGRDDRWAIQGTGHSPHTCKKECSRIEAAATTLAYKGGALFNPTTGRGFACMCLFEASGAVAEKIQAGAIQYTLVRPENFGDSVVQCFSDDPVFVDTTPPWSTTTAHPPTTAPPTTVAPGTSVSTVTPTTSTKTAPPTTVAPGTSVSTVTPTTSTKTASDTSDSDNEGLTITLAAVGGVSFCLVCVAYAQHRLSKQKGDNPQVELLT